MSTSVGKNDATAPRKDTYHHGDLRNALLAAARDLVNERGLDGFGLREVSRRAGVSHTAVYNHFASRSALVETLVVEAFDALTEALQQAGSGVADPLQRLIEIGIAYVRFAYARPAEFRFMFRPELCSGASAANPEPLLTSSRASYEPLKSGIADCLAAGALVGDPDLLALIAWSGVHGLASLIVDGPLREDVLDMAAVERLARGVVSSLFGTDAAHAVHSRQAGPS
jgi:AcrR family transcriptional regulator